MPKPRPPARSPKNSARAGAVIGVDLGATKVVAGVVAPDGRIVRHSGRLVHENDGAERVTRVVVESIRAALGDGPTDGARIGIAVAAQVDPTTGRVVHAPNLRWRDVPLARLVSRELGAPVRLINDARAATLAEWTHGAGVGEDNLFCLSLGTGVGGSAVVDGRLVEGSRHAFGEVGHLTVVADGRACHCPNRGCLEAYVGGWGIAERARDAARAGDPRAAALVSRAGGVDAISARTVFESYRAGDALSARLVEETDRRLADGAVSIANAFNPSLIVVAGGLVTGRPEFVATIESAIRTRCQPPAAGARVVRARLGEDAQLVGAACAARAWS